MTRLSFAKTLLLIVLGISASAVTVLNPSPNAITFSVFSPNETIRCGFIPTNEPLYATLWVKVRLQPADIELYTLDIASAADRNHTYWFNFTAPQTPKNYTLIFWERLYLEPSYRTDPKITGLTTTQMVKFTVRNQTQTTTSSRKARTKSLYSSYKTHSRRNAPFHPRII
ncbi:hypothetical protein BDR26DRAFT_874072 [Obelidium mucronatum]|nr:hypothetical protein BDR26DRAFT_874072 [Obelidium mucronatum]